MENRWEKMRDEAYHARAELSSTQLRTFMKSPYSYRASLCRPQVQTDAMRFGSAAHLALLQPDDFGNQAIVAPKCDRRTKEGKALWEKFQAGCSPDSLILTEGEWKQASLMAEEVRASPEFMLFANAAKAVEIAGFATIDGIQCRIKPDMLGEDFILDYKTTTSCSARAFDNSIRSFGYAIQAAFYCLVAERVDGKRRRTFLFVAQEKADPYEFGIFQMDPIYLEKAIDEVEQALRRFALCMELGDWPKMRKDVQIVSMPRWYDGTAPLFGEAEGDDQ